MAMTNKEKKDTEELRAKLVKATERANVVEELARMLLEVMREDIEEIARDAVDEAVDDLQISR